MHSLKSLVLAGGLALVLATPAHVAVAVSTTEVQARLLPLRDGVQIAHLHESACRTVACPWAQTCQQSHRWVIETATVDSAIAWLPRAGLAAPAQVVR